MHNKYLILLQLIAFNASAYVTVGTDGDCDFDSNDYTIQALIDSGETNLRITNQQVIYESMVVNKSITINGGFDTCEDAENFVFGSVKTEFNGGNSAPVFSVNSPNDGSDLYFSVKNLAIQDGLNVGDHHGGGISAYDNNDNFIQITVENSVIRNNQGAKGGGIYMKGDQVLTNLFHTTIINNLATGQIVGTALGGGVYCHSGEFNLNRNSGISLNQAYSVNQSTGHGGGIYATDSCELDIKSGTDGGVLDFRGINLNSASTHGGGVLLARNAYMKTDSEIYNNPININGNYADANNSGVGNGGGVFISDSSMFNKGLKLVDNEAVNGGGVYVVNGGTFHMSYSSGCGNASKCNFLSGNTAKQDSGKGGLAYVDDADLYLKYAYVTNNKADLGSVVYATDDSYVLGRASMVYRNGGNDDGWMDEHIFYLEGGELNLTNMTMAFNHAISATIKQVNGTHDIFASIIYEPITNQISNFLNTTGYKDCLMVDNNFGIGGGTSNIYIDDPLFVDANNDNFHLSENSPAIDRCANDTPTLLLPLVIDIDGEAIEYDFPDVNNGPTLLDMGADEAHVGDLIFSDGFDPEEV